jgi:hypothetical protein
MILENFLKVGRLFIFTLLVLILASCAGPFRKEVAPGKKNYKEKAEEILGKNISFDFNADSSLVLCVAERKPNRFMKYGKFLVFDTDKDSLIYSDSVSGAAFEWIKHNKLRITFFPEIVREGGNRAQSYIVNVFTGEKIKNKKEK